MKWYETLIKVKQGGIMYILQVFEFYEIRENSVTCGGMETVENLSEENVTRDLYSWIRWKRDRSADPRAEASEVSEAILKAQPLDDLKFKIK